MPILIKESWWGNIGSRYKNHTEKKQKKNKKALYSSFFCLTDLKNLRACGKNKIDSVFVYNGYNAHSIVVGTD